MVDPGSKKGVLNDWDLALWRNQPRKFGGERTGTVPFMALDLLHEAYWKGEIERLYRHDLEGLIWVLPWVFLQYENGVRVKDDLNTWCTGDYDQCYKEKRCFLDDFCDNPPTISFVSEWNSAVSALKWLSDAHVARKSAKTQPFLTSIATTGSLLEKSPQDTYQAFWQAFGKVKADDRSCSVIKALGAMFGF